MFRFRLEHKTCEQIPLIFCCWAYSFILYLGKENQFLQTNGPKIWCMKIALDQFTQSLLCTTAAPSNLSLVYLQTYCLLLTLLSKFLNCFVLKASVFKTKYLIKNFTSKVSNTIKYVGRKIRLYSFLCLCTTAEHITSP